MNVNDTVSTGTGDGRIGVAPGRKIRAFLWMVVSVILMVYVGTKIAAPNEVVIQALWIIGFGGMFTLGGQSLVDTMGQWAAAKAGGKIESKTVTTESKVVTEAPKP